MKYIFFAAIELRLMVAATLVLQHYPPGFLLCLPQLPCAGPTRSGFSETKFTLNSRPCWQDPGSKVQLLPWGQPERCGHEESGPKDPGGGRKTALASLTQLLSDAIRAGAAVIPGELHQVAT